MRTLWTRMTGALLLVASLATGPAALAGGHSQFNPDEIERAIFEFYDIYNRNNPDNQFLSQADKDEMADALADMIAVLEPKHYNSVVMHLGANYRAHPEHREPIEKILSSTRNKVAMELREDRESHPVFTIINDAFRVYEVAFLLGSARGIWRFARNPEGLKGVQRFAQIIQSVKFNRRQLAVIFGVGTAAGAIHAIYNHLETHRNDPNDILNAAKEDSVNDLAVRVVAVRDELRGWTDARARGQADAIRDRLNQLDPEVNTAADQLDYLLRFAPTYHSQMQPVAQDLQEIQRAMMRLDDLLTRLGKAREPVQPQTGGFSTASGSSQLP